MAGNKTSRPAVDWERVEADYRAGVLSVREIASQFGCSHVAIAKRAQREGWDRDLGAKIKAKADSLVTSSVVTSEVTSQKRASDRLIIDANATAIANVRIKHRGTISRSQDLADKLLSELESTPAEELGARTKIMKDLVDVQVKLINTEREAYGLNDEVKESDASRGRADRLARARASLGSNG